MFSKQSPNKTKESQETTPRSSGPGNTASKKKEFEEITSETLRLVIDSMDKKVDVDKFDALQKKEFNQQIHDQLDIVLKEKHRHLSYSDKQKVVQYVADEMFGFGPITSLVSDPGVTEIMVNSFDNIYIEMGGRLTKTDISFRDNDHVLHIINKIINPIGRRIDESCPSVDARLPDGSRVNAIIPPLALKGPSITIRKFSAAALKTEDLISYGTLTDRMAEFIQACVRGRLNIIVSGGTGSGKTTTLNTLSSYIPDRERIVTIEDTAELKLHQDHVVTLESRNANIEGKGEYTIRELVRNSLRMRPDRIVIGEVRGGEALDMLQAMNTGHDGSISTLHANNPREALARLETMVLMAGMDLPLRAIREQVAAAIDLIVHQARLNDGSRKIVKITEVLSIGKDGIEIQDIFSFKQKGVDGDGLVIGEHEITGNIPQCLERLASYGENILQAFPEWQNKEEDTLEEKIEVPVVEKREVVEKEVVKVVYVKEEPCQEEIVAVPLETKAIEGAAKEVIIEPVAGSVVASSKDEVDFKPQKEVVEGSSKETISIPKIVMKEEVPTPMSTPPITLIEEPVILLEAPVQESVNYLPLQTEVVAQKVGKAYGHEPLEGFMEEIPLPDEELEGLLESQEEIPAEEYYQMLAVDEGKKEVEPVVADFEEPVVNQSNVISGIEDVQLKKGESQPQPDLKKRFSATIEDSTREQDSELRRDSEEESGLFGWTKQMQVEDYAQVMQEYAEKTRHFQAEAGKVAGEIGVKEEAEILELRKKDISAEAPCLGAPSVSEIVEEKVASQLPVAQGPTAETPVAEIMQNDGASDMLPTKGKTIPFRRGFADLLELETVSSLEAVCSGPEKAEVGQTVTFVVTVSNKSEIEDLSKIVVTGNKFDITRKINFLPAGHSRTLEINYTVKEEDYPKLENKIIIFALNGFAEELVCEEKCVIAIMKPEIKVLNNGPDTAKVGQVITYTIVVNNPGKVSLSNILVTDSKQDWTQKLDSLAAGLSQTYEAKYTVTEDDYPTLESIVTVRARNSYGKEVFAEDMHNVFVVFEDKKPEVEEKTTPRMIGVLHTEHPKEEEHSSEPVVEREEKPASLASMIPENMRGVSLLMNEITALSGLVQTGDRVDVYLISAEKESNRKEGNHNIIEKAIFLKENRVPGEKRERAVILAVSPAQAESLATAYSKGSFYLVLRSSQEEQGKAPWQDRLVVG